MEGKINVQKILIQSVFRTNYGEKIVMILAGEMRVFDVDMTLRKAELHTSLLSPFINKMMLQNFSGRKTSRHVKRKTMKMINFK